jgi:hypothetical protein
MALSSRFAPLCVASACEHAAKLRQRAPRSLHSGLRGTHWSRSREGSILSLALAQTRRACLPRCRKMRQVLAERAPAETRSEAASILNVDDGKCSPRASTLSRNSLSFINESCCCELKGTSLGRPARECNFATLSGMSQQRMPWFSFFSIMSSRRTEFSIDCAMKTIDPKHATCSIDRAPLAASLDAKVSYRRVGKRVVETKAFKGKLGLASQSSFCEGTAESAPS